MEKKHVISAIGLFAIISLFIFSANASITGNAVVQYANIESKSNAPLSAQSGDVQVVQLSMQNGDYTLSPAKVVVNTPVRLVGDMNSIRGCYTTIVIPDLGVRKTVSASDNIIEFTPTKAGTFQMTCGMGMAGGQLLVEDASGNVPAPSESQAATPSGGSCGVGGGCGCGGA